MLIEFSCSNFRSIKEKATFSMLMSNNSCKNSTVIKYKNSYISKLASIYGPNGSGKSNLISAISLAKNIIVNSINHQPGQKIFQQSHKLNGSDIPSTFDFNFVVDDIRYAYGFSVINGVIDEEYLYYFPKNRQLKIFERKGMKVTPGNKYRQSFILVKEVLKENRLFLSCSANFSNVEEVEKAFLFFKEDIVVYKTSLDAPSMNNWLEYSMDIMNRDNDVKRECIKFLNLLGTGIKDIGIKVENVDIDKIGDNIPEKIKELLLSAGKNNTFKSMKARVIYEKFSTDLETEESTGIQKLFQIVCPFFDILRNGKVLICDEIETGLHETIVLQIIQQFCKLYQEKYAQLIFTTHDTNLLDLDLLQRDQIWFTQLNKERATDLYSLLEIKDVRKYEKKSKRYIEGRYGAIPILNENLVSDFFNSKDGIDK